jgi:hypothetical protein
MFHKIKYTIKCPCKNKTALLSYGCLAKCFTRLLNFHLVLNCWVRGNAVKANQIDFPEMKSYASIDELLADEVDLVIVNTPSRRITNTLKVLGKHAVVEKHLRQR